MIIIITALIVLRISVSTTSDSPLETFINIALVLSVFGMFAINRRLWDHLPLVILFLLFIFEAVASNAYNGTNVALAVKDTLFLVLPALTFIIFNDYLEEKRDININAIMLISIASLTAFFVYARILDKYIYVDGNYFHAAYFSTLHDNAYMLAITSVLALSTILFKSSQKSLLVLSLFSFTYCSYYLFRSSVDTALLLFFIITAVIMLKLFNATNRAIVLWFLSIALISMFGYFFYGLDIGSAEYYKLGNGRLGMWHEQIYRFFNKEPLGWIIGSGTLGDLIYSKIWFWDPKVAHNQMISIIVRYGFVGFFLLIAILWYLYYEIKRVSTPFFAAGIVITLIVTSTASDGIIARIVPGLSFWLVIALIIHLMKSSELRAFDKISYDQPRK